jgi:Spy/CpxP family protein refolding chaperone
MMADYAKLKAEYEALKDKKQRCEAQKEVHLKTLLELGCADIAAATAKIDALIDEEAALKTQMQTHLEKIETVLEKTR